MYKQYGYTIVEIFLLISLLGVIWSFAELDQNEIVKKLARKAKLEKIKLIIEDQIIYTNLTKEKVYLRYLFGQLVITGNKFIKTIPLESNLVINTKDQQLAFYPKQVCQPASIYLDESNKKCSLTI